MRLQARVVLHAPIVAGTFPASFDPGRHGSHLLAGNAWQTIQANTPDHGWANLIAQCPFALGSSPLPTSPAMLGVYPDATFGQAVRISNLPGASGMTAQSHHKFPGTPNVWVRWTVKLVGSDSTIGFTSRGTESGTYKLAFLWPGDKTHGRQSFVLMGSGELAIEQPATTGTVTNLVATDPTTPPPQPYGAFKGFYASDVPTMGVHGPSNLLRSNDWYALHLNVSPSGPTEFLQRWFLQRITVGGLLSPWQYPTWKGFRVSGVTPPNYNEFWLTGNKSGAAAVLQWMWLGPFEVTNAQDPYGWDHYGR